MHISTTRSCSASALGDLDAHTDDTLVLGVAQRRRFARRATRHQAMRAVFDLPVDERLEGVFIDRAVGERRDKRDK
jgi:hypothetical protein